jgi:two-component system phosphate regulon sensor histidine kinase PhoR
VQGGVVAFNPRAAALAPALRRGEPVSLGLRVPEVLDAVRRANATGSAQRAEFFERVPVVRWHEVVATPIDLSGARPSSPEPLVLLTFHDLTPLRRVEEMRADFVANASHELRTPLAALSGFIETLQGAAKDDAAAREKFLAIMQAQATRMARLIDDLLSLSRIELNAHLRPDREVDLTAIVRQVVDGLQMLARDRSVEVQVSAPAERVLVKGDRDELLRVFENLVENALKYAASGKRVDVTLTRDAPDGSQNEARVAVRDYGPGIAPEHLPRLTERFYRVDVADSRAQGGTGLGLALVKHILNRHGGRLTIESVTGQGATFTAHLPLGGAAPVENPQGNTAA